MIWGIVSILIAFFLGPLAKTKTSRLILSGLYGASAVFFFLALFELEVPDRFRPGPQTLALFDLSFVVDVLSLIFCLLISMIGGIVMAYSSYYIDEDDGPRFSTLINFFTLSMLGLVLSHNLLGLFIFWEFIGLCSYFLISFDGSNEAGRRAAWQALLISSFGGLCLLCGLLILGGIGGNYDLLEIRMPQSHPWLGTTIILIFIGVFSKSALFPFHFWLPNAMSAPSPASAYLHSATMVKAGIFLLLRLSPLISNHPYWTKILIPVGVATAALSSVLLLFEKDLKRILAYTTLAALGLIVYMIGRNDAIGYYLGIFWLITHALYKAPLFLLAGNIEHYSGSRDVTILSGLYPRMKGSLLVAFLAAFSLLSLPPVLAYRSKESFFSLLGDSPLEFWSLILLFATTGSVAFTILAVFLRGMQNQQVKGRFFNDEDDPAMLWLPPAAGLLVPLIVGVRYVPFTQYLRENLGQVLPYEFHLLGLQPANNKVVLIASVAIVFFAIFFAAVGSQMRKQSPFAGLRARLSFDRLWDIGFDGLFRGARYIYNRVQHNRLELYSLTVFIFLFFLISQIFFSETELALPLLSLRFTLVTPFEVFLILAIIIAAVFAMRAESNLSALAVLGIVGFGIAYLYLINAAPDLALTQFLVEALTLILLVLTFKHLPKIPYRVTNSFQRTVFLGISIVFGIGAGLLTFLASSSLRSQSVTRYFADKAVNLAHGRNVVNVTIVDFRGLDTLGEVLVLVLAALGIASLINRRQNNIEGASK